MASSVCIDWQANLQRVAQSFSPPTEKSVKNIEKAVNQASDSQQFTDRLALAP